MPFTRGGLCTHCGRPPLSKQNFNSIAEMETVVDSDASHGVPGHDVADFVSMQKAKRQRQGKLALALWVILLIAGGGVVYYNREIEKPIAVESSDSIKEEKAYQQTLAQSSSEAVNAFSQFILAEDANEKSEFVLGGVRKILNLEQQENSLNLLAPRPPLRLLANSYSDDGALPRVELILEDQNGQRFETVMWKDDSKWLLDWEQYVRYTQGDWSQFLANKRIGTAVEFRLYVRRRYIGGGREREKLQLIFYRPKMQAGERAQESPRLDVPKESPFFARLEAAFDAEMNKQDEVRKSATGRLDKAGLLRVKVTLDWRQGAEDERVMVLKDLAAMHWFELEPTKVVQAQE